ncbi:cupin domain-containing protein [Novosphingobium sp. ZN18A2]|uniref:cupin domain-containing protein n=1 Tax=Novosphingobium sp. ZN18A2 TaxID=3079861 RepID=UPI0030D55F9B
MNEEAHKLIARLNLQPHPEGGHFRETWRAPAPDGDRAASTAILFLLATGERSHWHRVDADEIWMWHAGDPLLLSMAEGDAGPATTFRLGADIHEGELPQHVIAAGSWQAACPLASGNAGYVLVSCVVAPAFRFEGFELAAPGWEPGT